MHPEEPPRKRLAAEPVLKSQKSELFSFVRFTNRTKRRVNVVWASYEGQNIMYKRLVPDQYVDINTFVGHPWQFFDADTGDQMVVEHNRVYQPVPWNKDSNNWPPQRRGLDITLPVYSLQECCLQKLRGLVPLSRVDELEVTAVLKGDLKRLIKKSIVRL